MAIQIIEGPDLFGGDALAEGQIPLQEVLVVIWGLAY